MILVENLTRRYGRVTAVDSISFEVGRGEVVGFLGPNGAGKSTTMRMLACYLPPTSGRAEVAGYDVFADSIRARERIGYMPENVPLPADMRVNDYLAFRARLKGVPGRRIRERVADAAHLCGLEGAGRQFIGNLSKGFRQRVGLADAMVHEPDLLILDEPTIGLDPNQIRQVRALIKNLARHHTLLLSSHILPEVEMTCSRVIIIHAGRIQAVGSAESLREKLIGAGRTRLEARVPSVPAAREKLEAIEGVEAAEAGAGGPWTTFLIHARRDVREDVAELARREGWPLRELSRQAVSLEEVFAEATKAGEGA
ncbi:MAG: ABC transporter ATP-binding protein [Terrimicrobiaceae bacterium]|nr:ABC transporter ATP-binding protein [Terrimicrobiaceae bacterium]